jgi:AraC family transcriptional regulator
VSIKLEPNAFFGVVHSARQMGTAHVSLSEVAPGVVVPPHVHSSAYLCFVLRGGYREDRAVHRPGDVIIRPRGFEHSDHIGQSGTLCLNVEWTDGPAAIGHACHRRPWLWDVGRRLASCLDLERDFDDEDARLVNLLFDGLTVDDHETPLWVRQARQAIAEQPEKHWRLEDLAIQAGVHPVHFSRTFRSTAGETLREFVLRKRLEGARGEIGSGAPLGEIAAKWGFADQAHFCRSFRTAYGCTPREYVRKTR